CLEAVEYIDEILILHAPVAAQVHLLLAAVLHFLSDALLQHVGVNRIAAEIQDMVLTVPERHRDKYALVRDLARLGRHRQIHIDAPLDHRRGDHEYDEQHEHDVDERNDVDLGERARYAPHPAETSGRSIGDRSDLR